jgi:hypothetical protein
MKQCMNPGCIREVSGNYLMCPKHWFNVPKAVQNEVQKRLHGWIGVSGYQAAREYLFNNWTHRNAMSKG